MPLLLARPARGAGGRMQSQLQPPAGVAAAAPAAASSQNLHMPCLFTLPHPGCFPAGLPSAVQWSVYPPVAFIMMANDPPTNQKIVAHQAALHAAGVSAAIIPVPIRAVYWPSFFSDQASDMSVDLSGRTVSALQEVGACAGRWGR